MPRNALLNVMKNAVALLAGRASVMLFSFAFIIYAARFMGVDGFGKYALVRGYFELFLSLSASALGNVIIREIAKRPSWVGQYLSTSILLVSILTTMCSGILIVLAHISPYASDTRAAIYLTCLALLPATISLVFEAGFIAFEKAEYVTYGTVIENVLRTGLSFIVLFVGYGLLALFVVLIVTRMAMLLFYFVFSNRHVSRLLWFFDWAFLKRLIRDWRIFAVENWFSDLFWSLNVIALSFFRGELAVGLYSAAYRIVGLGSTVADSYTMAVFPYMSRLFEESKESFQRISESSLKYMLVFVLPGVITLTILADRIILLFYTDEYVNSIPIFRILIWVLILRFLNPYLSYLLFARGEQKKSLQIITISLILYVVICFWFIFLWGGVGAARALLLAVCVAFCLYLAFALGREGATRMLLTFGRMALAAVSLTLFVLVLKDIPLVLLLIGVGGVYVLLLLIFRVPSTNEIELVRKMALRGLHQIGTILGRA